MQVEFSFSAIEQSVEIAKADEGFFRDMIPKEGFLGAYMKYTDRQESPGTFHFWTAATLLGACLQRRAWVCKGIYNVYPNLYTMLVAPSGKCRKSRAISLGLELIEDFDWLNVIADKTTPEAMLQALMYGTKYMESDGAGAPARVMTDVDNCALIRAPELVDFINKQNHNSGLVALLTNLYDCPSSYKYLTRNKSPVVLRNVAIQMLGASTQDWFAKELPTSAFGGGFMSRFIFVVKQVRDRSIPFPEAPGPDEKRELQSMLLRIRANFTGNIPFEHAARVWFEEWYNENEVEAVDDPNLIGFHERTPDIILKVSLILAASRGAKIISDRDIRQAHSIVSWTQERAFKAFKDVDLSPLGQVGRELLDFLEIQGGTLTRRKIMRKFWHRLPNGLMDMERIEAMLVEAGNITVESGMSHGKTSKIYVLKQGEADDN